MRSMEVGGTPSAEIADVPARVPGSVQAALRDAGIIPDWEIGMNSRACEWVENRHWVYRAKIPDEWLDTKATVSLHCQGLDYCGCILVNGREIAPFVGSHVPHVFDLTPHLQPADNVLQVVFELPPRWLGQFGYTSQMTEWKPRFNYTWDWVPRLVQVGIWDDLLLVATDGNEIQRLHCTTDADPHASTGILDLGGAVEGEAGQRVRVALIEGQELIRAEDYSIAEFEKGVHWESLPIELWWPNLEGGQALYHLGCELLDAQGDVLDAVTRRVGFKHVEWRPCEGARAEADPWICTVNGRPVFLQGINWAPIRANFADVTEGEYRKRLEVYRDIGCNAIRVNGVGFLEKAWFYDLCDALGLLVWQDFPLSSSGVENWPPEDPSSIEALAEIAASYIERRQHHVSLLLWCGGNELQGDLEGDKHGIGKPVDLSHPLIRCLQAKVAELDPSRRFLPSSPTGPRSGANPAEFGKGVHWEVHGPYMNSRTVAWWVENYWKNDDALFLSEACAPGASPLEQIRQFAGDCATFPANASNPYWSRPTTWWIEWPQFVSEHGREPRNLEEYVTWSQQRQAQLLTAAARASKARFPRCGGILFWEGHDTFPIPANASILDFCGNPKPAALALAEVFKSHPSELGNLAEDEMAP
jgi:beta-mannosidase